MEHKTFKNERLDLSINKLNKMEKVLIEFFVEGLELDAERLETIEFRSRDGFSPHSHNKGGMQWSFFADAFNMYLNGSGFKEVDDELNQWYAYNEELYREDQGLSEDAELSEEQLYEFEEQYCMGCDDTVWFTARAMLEDENTLMLYFMTSADDMPYHRKQTHVLEFPIKFNTVKELETKLKELTDNADVRTWLGNISY